VNFFKEVIATRPKASKSCKKPYESSKSLKGKDRKDILLEISLET
jgi:hypothetical protein